MPVIPIEDVLFCDLETRSAANLKKVGSWRYAEDPSTDVFMACWAIGAGPIETWYPGEPVPPALVEHIEAGKWFSAHNIGFEYPMVLRVLAPRYSWPVLKIEQLHDTAAEAATMGLPRSLEEIGRALGLDIQKDAEGHAHMMRLCRPRRIIETENGPEYTWWEDPQRIQRLAEYCAVDVRVAREVFLMVRPMPHDERRVWRLDQKINQRGIKVDVQLAAALQAIVQRAKTDLDAEMEQITSKAVLKCSNAGALVRWLNAQGVATDSCAKAAVTAMLVDRDVPQIAKDALELRRTAAKASTAKLAVMQAAACADGRLKGMFRYHGAQTGRFSGALAQLHNLPRKSPGGPIAFAVDTAVNYGYKAVELLYGDPMQFASSMLRPCLMADDGEEMYTADLAQIEARMIAALAGEQAVLDVFEAGADIYCHMAGGIFGRSITKKNDQERQVGKVACIAEDSLVLTPEGLIPIQDLTKHNLIWDGVEWVSHDGVVCNGEREVIEYDGLRATPDHIVFTEDGRQVPIGHAAREQSSVATTGVGRCAVRLGESFGSGGSLDPGRHNSLADEQRDLCRVPGLRHSEMDQPEQSAKGQDRWVSGVLAAASGAALADEAGHGYARPLYQYARYELGSLWRARYPVQLSFGSGRGSLDTREPWSGEEQGAGSNRQQRALRSRQSALCDPIGKLAQSNPLESVDGRLRVGADMQPVRPSYDQKLPHSGLSEGSDNRISFQSGTGQTQELARHPGTPKRAWVYDLVNAGPRHRFTVAGKLVHNCLALGFQGGPVALKAMARNYNLDIASTYDIVHKAADPDQVERALFGWRCYDGDMSKKAYLTADLIKQAWRAANPHIVQYWANCELAVTRAVKTGKVYQVGSCTFQVVRMYERDYLWIRLPNRRLLCYTDPEIEVVTTRWGAHKESVRAWTTDSRTKKWTRRTLYGGLIVENCLAGDTEVLTRRGWIHLKTVRSDDWLWDGIEWVRHDGLVCKGAQQTIELSGVRLTGDHLVLTAEGWRRASSCEGLNRAAVRTPDLHFLCRIEWGQVHVARPVRLRHGEDIHCFGIKEGQDKFLRMSCPRTGVEKTAHPRHEWASRLLGLAIDERPMQASLASGLGELWRAGHRSLSRVAGQFRSLLEGYGSDVPAGTLAGPGRQQRSVYPRQLPLGDFSSTECEPAKQRLHRNSVGPDDCGRGVKEVGNQRHDSAVPDRSRLPSRSFVRRAGLREPVYDLVNAGPRNRFTVRGEDAPFIVHNCVQGAARDVLVEGMLRLDAAGYAIVGHVHDEVILTIKRGAGSRDQIADLMTQRSDWMVKLGLPVGVDVSLPLSRYQK